MILHVHVVMMNDQDAESEFMDNSWPQFNTTPRCFHWYINGFYDTMGSYFGAHIWNHISNKISTNVSSSSFKHLVKFYIQNNSHVISGASPGFGRGGGKKFFVQIWEFACRKATCCAWRSHALC